MTSSPAIRIAGLSKSYTIRHDQAHRPTNLGEAVMQRLRKPLQRAETETFWALKDVNLEIAKGEVVGVIGRNGAGKSTLLKVLSRITEPTTGRIELYGRVGSLLEVGTGFHPELTGRENIFLNGAILGMRRSEIRKQFDAIVDFAGVEKFLDTPVKRYSSGMYVRLAFAVAAHLNPEILIVDEVLAVGDAEFQKKCLGKMQDVAQSGRTVLFVSHNLTAVETLCSSAVYLKAGKKVRQGGVSECLSTYQRDRTNVAESADRRRGSGEFRITEVQLNEAEWTPSASKTIAVRYEKLRSMSVNPFVIVEICDNMGRVCARMDSRLAQEYLTESGGELVFKLQSPWLIPGEYELRVTIDSGYGFIDVLEHAACVTVSAALPYDYQGRQDAFIHAPVLSDFEVFVNSLT